MVTMAPLPQPKFAKSNKMKKVAKVVTDKSEDEKEHEQLPREVFVIAQEVQMVKALASNDLNKRNKQMRKLKKWLQLRSRSTFPFTEEDFLRIWKGLYYHMWFSDKPLVQEELAEEMGKLLDCFDGNVKSSVEFFSAFMKTMCQQWFGMDQWRMDKFMMLVRRMLRAMFFVLKKNGWSKEAVQNFNTHMIETILSTDTIGLGLVMHYLDIFFEELAKVADGELNAEQVGEFIKPFVNFLCAQTDYKLIEHCRKKVFHHLLYQSDLGRDYEEKYNAWRRMGFPTRSINDLEKVENAEETEEIEESVENSPPTKHLDPRAGNVDVFLAELPIDAKYVIEEIENYLRTKEMNTKRRKMLRNLLQTFETFKNGIFPLGVKNMPRFESKSDKPLIKDKIEKLENLENEVYGTDRKLKQLNKRKRRKLLKALNFQDADESNFNQLIEKALPKQLLKEKRLKAQQSLMTGWLEEEIEDVTVSKKANIVNEKNKNIKNKKHKLTDNEVVVPLKKMKKPLEAINKQQQVATNSNAESDNSKEILSKNLITQPDSAQETKEKESNLKSMESKDDVEKSVVSNEKKINDTNKASTQPKPENISKPGIKQTPVLKIGSPNENNTKPNASSEWDTPLAEGEIEYFIPSNKLRMKEANKKMTTESPENTSTPVRKNQISTATPKTPGSTGKRVKIALKHNTSQNPSEYLKQIKNSPDVPYDASKKPTKGLLKPNLMPSPINPFYKKKLGLRSLNDSI